MQGLCFFHAILLCELSHDHNLIINRDPFPLDHLLAHPFDSFSARSLLQAAINPSSNRRRKLKPVATVK
jgi:hypothetical protein